MSVDIENNYVLFLQRLQSGAGPSDIEVQRLWIRVLRQKSGKLAPVISITSSAFLSCLIFLLMLLKATPLFLYKYSTNSMKHSRS
jgi:hypothetical protein